MTDGTSMSAGVAQMIGIIENQQSELRKFIAHAEEARKHFKRTKKDEILISPDTFKDSKFDNILESRSGKLELAFKETEDKVKVPRGWQELSFVTRVRFETDVACVLELICTGSILKRWMLTKGSILEECCTFPLTGARFSEIYFSFRHQGTANDAKTVKITLFGVVFGNSSLCLHGMEWAVASEIYKNDTIVGSFPCFCLKNEILYRASEEELDETTFYDRQRFSVD